MRCRQCGKEFNAQTAKLRGNKGTGGSDDPSRFAFALLAGIGAWLMGWWWLQATPYRTAYIAIGGLVSLIILCAWFVAYADKYNAVCPECGTGGHTRWPWSR